MAPRELTFFCDTCKQPVADGDGYIHASHTKILAHQKAMADFAATSEHTGADLAAFLDLPGRAGWQVHHPACDPEKHADYCIYVEQINTWRGLMSMTAHLMGKTWLGSTDWAALLRETASGEGPRILPGDHTRRR
jgi:hypothetical protein